jgi:hypothetical protein
VFNEFVGESRVHIEPNNFHFASNRKFHGVKIKIRHLGKHGYQAKKSPSDKSNGPNPDNSREFWKTALMLPMLSGYRGSDRRSVPIIQSHMCFLFGIDLMTNRFFVVYLMIEMRAPFLESTLRTYTIELHHPDRSSNLIKDSRLCNLMR